MDVFKEQALAGKVVFIAGGSSGINLGIAQHFARHGAKIALISRTMQDIGDTALFLASGNARYITGAIIDCDGGCKLGDASVSDTSDYALRV